MSKNISEDEFYEMYKPITNHFVSDASWNGCLFETYGEEIQYCFELAKKENRVWTILESDKDSVWYIVSGFHYVNRLGFMVTEFPYTEEIEVLSD